MPEMETSTENSFVKRQYRSITAYFLMICFVIFTSLGVGLIFMPAGLVTLGVTSGLFGYLLGAN